VGEGERAANSGATGKTLVETMREDQIEAAITQFSGDKFERFATELVSRALYPGLNPTSPSHDLGEDARTEPTTVFMHNGLWVSLAISKTGTWDKLQGDCLRCKETGRRIDTVVFVTAGNPRTDTVEDWRRKVKQEFDWDLEVRALRWLAPAASRPEHESLVDDYLGIPPPDGDFIQNIETEFSRHTNHALEQIRLHIPGMSSSLPRNEIVWIEDQLSQGKSVLLVGDAGTGKSGIGASLARSAGERHEVVLLLDARHVGYIKSETELRQHLALNGSIASAVGRVGRHKGCRVIIDQLDNIAGSVSARLLVELAVECSPLTDVEIIVISRKREAHEVKLLNGLTTAGFVELISHPLSETRVEGVLKQLGISQFSADLVALGRNLLNLELIGAIKQRQPNFDFSALMDEVDLWEQYIQILSEREEVASSSENAEQIVAEAVKLARSGLRSKDRTFCLDYPVSHSHRRLVSWGIIVYEQEDGRVCRFRHEKLQDFLYAWDAIQRRVMPTDVLDEINIHKSRNVLTWMDEIYSRRSPQLHRRFLREMLNVQ